MRRFFFYTYLYSILVFTQEAVGEPLVPTVFTNNDNTEQFIPVAGADPFAALGTILHLDTRHLVALGIGIVAGASIVGPNLEVGELTGILIGVIIGDLMYREFLEPEKHNWIPDDLF